MSDLIERLEKASSRPERNDMGIGDYWNLCDEAAEALRERDTTIAKYEADDVRYLQTLKERDAEIARLESELEEAHRPSWQKLMAMLDAHWPASIFPTLPDNPNRDSGPRIVSLLRWVDAAEARVRELEGDAARFAWLANRLEDVQIDNADPCEYLTEECDWVQAWRAAIDAARGERNE